MPNIIDLIPVGYSNDGRRKITDEQNRKLDACTKSKIPRYTIFHEQLELVGVVCSLFCFLSAHRPSETGLKEVKRWQVGNLKENHTPAMQKHRAKKKQLLASGQVKITPEVLTKYRAKLNERNLNKHETTKRKTAKK